MTSLSSRWISTEKDEHIIYSDFTETFTADLTLNDVSNNDDDGYLFVESGINFTLSNSNNTLTINGLLVVHGANIILINGSTYTSDGGTIQNGSGVGNVTGFEAGDWLFYLGTGIDSNMTVAEKDDKLYESAVTFSTTSRNEALTDKVGKDGGEKTVARNFLKNSEKKRRSRQWGIRENVWNTTVSNIFGALTGNGATNATTNKTFITQFVNTVAGINRHMGSFFLKYPAHKSHSGKLKAMFKEMQQNTNYRQIASAKGAGATWLDKRLTFNRADIKDTTKKHTGWQKLFLKHMLLKFQKRQKPTKAAI